MQQNPLTTFLDRVKQLPLDLREGILNVDFLSALREIQTKNKLHIDQGAGMEELTYKLILGDLEEGGYVNNLEEMIHVDNQSANNIAADVNEKILQPIREQVQILEEENAVLGLSHDPATEAKAKELATSAPATDAEYHNGLTPENILAEIENPQASIGTIHQTIIPSATPVAVSPSVIQTAESLPSSAPSPSSSALKPGEIATKTTYPTSTPETPKPAVISIAEALGQKLTEAQISRPTEIKHSIDPYHEPI